MATPQRDRFDDIPRDVARVGAHRAEQPRLNRGAVLLGAFVAALILIVAGIFVSFVLMGRITFGSEPAPSPTPSETGIIDTSYEVLILNATPEEGLDAEIRAVLIDAGWVDSSLLSSGAANDFPATTVIYVNDDDRAAALGIAEVIGGAEVQQDPEYPVLSGGEGKQIALVIGLDRSSAAAPPATAPAG